MSKIFSLEGQGLKLDSAADIEPHLASLISSTDVEEVRLQGNTLGVEACAALASVLSTKKTLRTAQLADIFTGRLLSEIPAALTSLLEACLALPLLHTVDLSDNAFGLNTVEPLRPFLSQHVPLRHLILNNNGLGPAAGALVAQALTQLADRKERSRNEEDDGGEGTAVVDVPELETVVCGRNRLEAGSMKAWAEAFRANKGVKTVRMVQNGIRQEGIVTLLRDGLVHAKGLETVDLQDNTFTAKGSKALADVVRSGAWEGLKELAVGDCLLSARGGVYVMEALGEGKVKGLEVLKLQYNDIDGRGVKALEQALGELPKLRKVELNGNKFPEDDESVEKIKALLEERREAAGEDEDEERWGVDELDDLEEADSDDEEAEEDSEEDGEAEDEDDVDVADLTAKLDKTGI